MNPSPCCDLAAHASCRAAVESLAALRRQPGPVRGLPLPTNLLRHSDEQTVAGLAAVLTAIDQHDLIAPGDTAAFRDWGVVAAPRFVGRPSVAQTMARFLAEGAWGLSPHVIPHRSLHSVPGTISQALGLHGPNFGVGGGPGCEAEAILAGLTLLHEMHLPGVWVILSRMEPEGYCDPESGQAAPGTVAHAIALALRPCTSATRTILEVAVSPTVSAPPLCLAAVEDLVARSEHQAEASHPLDGIGRLTLRRGVALAGPHRPFFAHAARVDA